MPAMSDLAGFIITLVLLGAALFFLLFFLFGDTLNENKVLRQRIDSLIALTNERSEQLGIRLYWINYDGNHEAVIGALHNELQSLKAQGREAVFELMLCSSHRAFMRFLREYGE